MAKSKRRTPEDWPEDGNVLALVKGKEKYIFLYTDQYKREVLQCLGKFASRDDLSFTWYDAAVLSQRIRKGDEDEHEEKSSHTCWMKVMEIMNIK